MEQFSRTRRQVRCTHRCYSATYLDGTIGINIIRTAITISSRTEEQRMCAIPKITFHRRQTQDIIKSSDRSEKPPGNNAHKAMLLGLSKLMPYPRWISQKYTNLWRIRHAPVGTLKSPGNIAKRSVQHQEECPRKYCRHRRKFSSSRIIRAKNIKQNDLRQVIMIQEHVNQEFSVCFIFSRGSRKICRLRSSHTANNQFGGDFRKVPRQSRT